jgi:hypothetical protein
MSVSPVFARRPARVDLRANKPPQASQTCKTEEVDFVVETLRFFQSEASHRFCSCSLFYVRCTLIFRVAAFFALPQNKLLFRRLTRGNQVETVFVK